MKRPLIGVPIDSGEKPGKYALNMDYVQSVEKAGGVPVAIPFGVDHGLIAAYVEAVDGVLLIGGDDLDPGLYGEERHPQAIPIHPERQSFELGLLAEVERRRLPVLGVCLGCQLMNVHRGGSLHQYLPEVIREGAIEHRRAKRVLPAHAVWLEMDSALGRAIGKSEIMANTYHKQAINRVGRGLRVVARAADGVIEGVEDPDLPLFAGVQWHPERLHHEPDHLAVFRLLVEKAVEWKARG